MSQPSYPLLFQINTRVRLSELSAVLGRPATLDDVKDAELDGLARDGFDFVWFLGVWQTGEAARRVSASNPEWRAEYRRILPDFRESDVCGSCFAVRDYRVHADFGGDDALARLRERLRKRGLRLILDFVPNHMAPDHRWVEKYPDFFVAGTEQQLAAQPHNYCRLGVGGASRVVAYGRDPYFAGWPDTLQLNYGNPALQNAMLSELRRIAHQCDGVRCDMAMLVLPEVFSRTWGIAAPAFWPRATAAVRAEVSGFLFIAEVYWDLEWTLQQQGFDYTYDKRLYDRLEHGPARPVREHLLAGLDFQDRLVRFLENHDEPRAAATFEPDVHEAAAVVTFLTPGLRFVHQGQREGKRVRIPVHLGRGPAEVPDQRIAAFYAVMLACLKEPGFRNGRWQLLETRPAWDGNGSNNAFIAFSWIGPGDIRHLVAVNYASHQSQCYVTLPWRDLADRRWRLRDRLGAAVYERDGADLSTCGLYLDMPPWGIPRFCGAAGAGSGTFSAGHCPSARTGMTIVKQPEPATSEFPPLRLTLRDGRSVTIRAIRPDDADATRAALEGLSAEARYSRFMSAVKVTPAMVERAVLPVSDRERALVAVAGEDPDAAIVGGARYVRGRDSETCEFAVTIAEGWRGTGLASGMLRALIRDASARGLKHMEGYVLAANKPMLDLARRLNFEVGASDEGPSVDLVRLDLARAHPGGN